MKKNILDGYLLLSPKIKGLFEWGILIASGILGISLSWTPLPFEPLSNVIGGILICSGFAFHIYSERFHHQAHQQADEIRQIITTGVYAHIRHPLYLSLIVMDIGIALAFGNIWSLLLAAVISLSMIMTALKEEVFLREKFGEYGKYMEKVPWRMIPGIF
jgi:protein-S-isoprenylcysteine O-methyltransferase Ste14